MANAFFAGGIKAFADKQIDWLGDTIKLVLLDNSFVPLYDTATPIPNITNASFLSDISSAIVGPAVTLTGKGNTAGVLSASDGFVPAVTGNVVVRMVIYQHTGVAGTSILIVAYDTGGGFPITPKGGNIPFHFDTGPYKIAQI